jgi:hypothetical protein
VSERERLRKGGGLGSGVSRTVDRRCEDRSPSSLAATLIGIAVVAAVDALRGSSSEQPVAQASGTEPPEPTLSTPESSAPRWPEAASQDDSTRQSRRGFVGGIRTA